MSARQKKPTGRGKPPPIPDPSDSMKTTVFDTSKNRALGSKPPEPSATSSNQIKVVSMKTPGVPGAQPQHDSKPVPKVKLRAISEVSPLKQAQPQNLGYLAPPRDPSEVRARKLRDYVIWGCLSVILASAIALGIWFLAR